MEPTKWRIREAIHAHMALAAAYERMMADIDNKGLFFRSEEEAGKTNPSDMRQLALDIVKTMIGFLTLLDPTATEPRGGYISSSHTSNISSLQTSEDSIKNYIACT